jgi:hypothetical protein
MVTRIFISTLLITSAIHAMDDDASSRPSSITTQMLVAMNDRARDSRSITIQEITTEQELQELIDFSSTMFDAIYDKDPLSEAQQNYSYNHRKERLQQLLTIPSEERHDIFVVLNDKRIGGVATRQDKQDPTRVIIDKAATDITPEAKKIMLGTVLQFIKKTYPKCTKVWTSVQKGHEGSEDQLTKFGGFAKSDYMDELHDPQFSQGWELNLHKGAQ